MANLQIVNKWNLISYSFADENQEICQKLKDLKKKLKGMRPCWAYWASKKCTKNKPALHLRYFLWKHVPWVVDFLIFGSEQGRERLVCLSARLWKPRLQRFHPRRRRRRLGRSRSREEPSPTVERSPTGAVQLPKERTPWKLVWIHYRGLCLMWEHPRKKR